MKEWEISWGPKPLRNLPIWSVPTKFADAGIRQSWSAARSAAWASIRPGDQLLATGGQTAGSEPALAGDKKPTRVPPGPGAASEMWPVPASQ